MRRLLSKDGWRPATDDDLIAAWLNIHTYKIFKQRKRLPDKTDPDVKDIQKVYFEGGSVKAVKYIMNKYNWRLSKAYNHFNDLRGRKRR